MDEQSKQFIEESDAVEQEEFERIRIQRVARSKKRAGKVASEPAPKPPAESESKRPMRDLS